MIWKYFTGALIALVLVFSFMPQISGDLNDLSFYSRLDSNKFIPVKLKLTQTKDGIIKNGIQVYNFSDAQNNTVTGILPAGYSGQELDGKEKIYTCRLDSEKNLIIKGIRTNSFFITFPFIPGLEERARIILIHVPIAWVSVLAFLVSMWFGIKYLRKKDLLDDSRSVNAASLGILFCVLATVTGSIWAKFNWGSFWNWDPRETSIFVLFLIYGAYFALRSGIDVQEKRATLSSIYSIIAFITVPFFIFILPRITAGLHPGSADDTTGAGGGPIVKSGMSAEMRIVFFVSLFAFSMLFFWIFQMKNRISKIELFKNNRKE